MLDLRRSTAAALLVGAALVSALTEVPALAAAPADAGGSSSTALPAAAADWTYYATYPDYGSCDSAGMSSGYTYQCVSSSVQPGGYDLYLWT